MSRISLEDTGMDMVIKMSGGNPGAVMAMTDILQQYEEIDPQAMMGGIGSILMLDTWEIYGTDIYVLYNDKCNKSVRNYCILMRATQLGIMRQERLVELSKDQSRQMSVSEEEFNDLSDKVCAKLEDFAKA